MRNEIQQSEISLPDGRECRISVHTYPMPREGRGAFIAFWQTEWVHTDIDWFQSLGGVYADSLTIQMVSAFVKNEIVGTASVLYPRADPEVCVIADVLTAASMRGQGIAAHLAEAATQLGFQAGCRLAYLGNKPTPKTVYDKIAFRRIAGAVMRRAAPGMEDSETHFYSRGQKVIVRRASWGDLPGVACLMAQPLSCMVADYPRGLLSLKAAEPVRCVSNFTSIWNDVTNRDGYMLSLVGETPHRILGFASLTPEPDSAKPRKAVLDAVTHEAYTDQLGLLIDKLLNEAKQRGTETAQAFVAQDDHLKLASLLAAGFKLVTNLSEEMRAGEQSLKMQILEY